MYTRKFCDYLITKSNLQMYLMLFRAHPLLTFLFSLCVNVKSLQLCPTLSDPRDCSSPGSSVHGILQARILEWVPMSTSRGSSQPRDQTLVSYFSCIGSLFLCHWCHLGTGYLGICRESSLNALSLLGYQRVGGL